MRHTALRTSMTPSALPPKSIGAPARALPEATVELPPGLHLVDGLRLAELARPLLQLVQHLTGMETSFITAIDWKDQHQDVLLSLNTGAIQVAEGNRVDWKNSLCRSMLLAGMSHSDEVATQVPGAEVAAALGIRSFLAVPILVDDTAIGTVCGASGHPVNLSEHQVRSMQLIADSVQQLVKAEIARLRAESDAGRALDEAIDARAHADKHEARARHMEQLAHTDSLTGVPNRRGFTARWEDTLARSGRKQYPVGVLLIDIDRFKDVNDSFGHPLGDRVLRAVAAAIGCVASSADVPGRLGGDEFALAMTHASEATLLETADRLRREFAIATAELGAAASLSIGIASTHACHRYDLLQAADQALYRSKAGGGDRAEIYAAPGTAT